MSETTERPRVKRGTFEMALSYGYEEYPAYPVGALAVHKARILYEDGEPQWRVSHTGTGQLLPEARFHTRAAAMHFAKKMDKDIDWSVIVRGSTPENVMGITDVFKAEYRRLHAEYFA